MDKAVIILAAGQQRRFQDDRLKQLLPICDGECFLSRMIRQAKARRATKIWVATIHGEIMDVGRESGASIWIPSDHKFTCSTIKSTYPLWTDRTIILLGDVYYSKNYMDMVFRFKAGIKNDLTFFATPAEVHAFRVETSWHEEILKNLTGIVKKAKAQEDGKVRKLMEKFSVDHIFKNQDESTDIDTPKEYEIFKRDVIHERRYKLTDRKRS